MKIQPMKDLIKEMRAVARGETAAPADAALASVELAEALLRLLTPETAACCARSATPSRNQSPSLRG